MAREAPYRPTAETELIERAANGDAASVNVLLERHLDGLRAFIRLRAGAAIRQRESETDLAQSVCRDVLENLGRFRHQEPNGFKRWLYSTALRKILNRHEYYSAEKRDVRKEAQLAGGTSWAGLGDLYRTFTTPSAHAMKQEEIERIERAFDALPEDEREVISLAHVVGLSRAEIAQQLGKSEGAVRTQLSRALARLAELVTGAA
jgi:RNA polymerase sigma-70 factor, ECF subfamily